MLVLASSAMSRLEPSRLLLSALAKHRKLLAAEHRRLWQWHQAEGFPNGSAQVELQPAVVAALKQLQEANLQSLLEAVQACPGWLSLHGTPELLRAQQACCLGNEEVSHSCLASSQLLGGGMQHCTKYPMSGHATFQHLQLPSAGMPMQLQSPLPQIWCPLQAQHLQLEGADRSGLRHWLSRKLVAESSAEGEGLQAGLADLLTAGKLHLQASHQLTAGAAFLAEQLLVGPSQLSVARLLPLIQSLGQHLACPARCCWRSLPEPWVRAAA